MAPVLMRVFERSFYWIVWVFCTFYSLYAFCQASNTYRHYLHSDDFRDGWKILRRKQDVSDTEWTMFKKSWISCWPWLAGHILISQLISRIDILSLMIFYTVYSLVFICNFFGVVVATLYSLNVTLLLIVHRAGYKPLCFVISFGVLFLLHIPQFSHFRNVLDLDDVQGFLFEVGLAWLNARCLSFTLDRIDERAHRDCTIKELVVIFAYCFYLPYFFTGPILNYVSYVQQIGSRVACDPKNTVLTFARYFAIYFVLDFLLHFCYSSSVQFYPELVEQFDAWTLVGLGYSLPLVFYLKYKVIYGFVCAISSLDGLRLPPPPICISRVHLCSHLWKRFDRGVHLWIARYLYAPLAGDRTLGRRVTASAACFAFMALWHGMQASIFAWSVLNFLGVAVEMVVSTIYKTEFQGRLLGPHNERRLQALVGTVCFIHMCLGCIFFLSSWEVGILFYKRIFAFPIPLVPILAIMYCGCCVSIQIRDGEIQSQNAS